MTTLSGRPSGRWRRGVDVWHVRTSTGTVVLVPGARAAVALSDAERRLWDALAEPQPVDVLGAGPDGGAQRAALARLAGLGVVAEER